MRPRYRDYVPSPTSFVYRRVCLDTTGCRSGVARQKVDELVLSCCSQVCTFGTVYRIHTLSLCDPDEIFLPGPPSPQSQKSQVRLFSISVQGPREGDGVGTFLSYLSQDGCDTVLAQKRPILLPICLPCLARRAVYKRYDTHVPPNPLYRTLVPGRCPCHPPSTVLGPASKLPWWVNTHLPCLIHIYLEALPRHRQPTASESDIIFFPKNFKTSTSLLRFLSNLPPRLPSSSTQPYRTQHARQQTQWHLNRTTCTPWVWRQNITSLFTTTHTPPVGQPLSHNRFPSDSTQAQAALSALPPTPTRTGPRYPILQSAVASKTGSPSATTVSRARSFHRQRFTNQFCNPQARRSSSEWRTSRGARVTGASLPPPPRKPPSPATRSSSHVVKQRLRPLAHYRPRTTPCSRRP